MSHPTCIPLLHFVVLLPCLTVLASCIHTYIALLLPKSIHFVHQWPVFLPSFSACCLCDILLPPYYKTSLLSVNQKADQTWQSHGSSSSSDMLNPKATVSLPISRLPTAIYASRANQRLTTHFSREPRNPPNHPRSPCQTHSRWLATGIRRRPPPAQHAPCRRHPPFLH